MTKFFKNEMTLKSAKILKISRKEAEDFISKCEHLGNIGLGVWHFGLFIENNLAAVQCFGTPCFDHKRGVLAEISKKHDLKIVQLCRGATAAWAPRNTPSITISMSLSYLSEKLGPLIVVAYADPSFGEVGTIYQACNAIYTGQTNPKGQAEYIINGERLSGWSVRKQFGTRDRHKIRPLVSDLQILPLKPKLRYVMVVAPPKLRQNVVLDLESIKEDYPKRDQLGIQCMK